MNRAEYRRQKRQEIKKDRVYTVTQKELDKMVKQAALELLEAGIKNFRDNELDMIRENTRKILSLYQAIWRDVLAEMGLLTRDNAEELVKKTGERWGKVDALIANRNLHELQQYADEMGADEDTFLNLDERPGTPRELAEQILEIEVEEE